MAHLLKHVRIRKSQRHARLDIQQFLTEFEQIHPGIGTLPARTESYHFRHRYS